MMSMYRSSTRTASIAAVAVGTLLSLAVAQTQATVLVRNDFSNMNDGLSFVGATNLDGSPVLPVQPHRADYESSGQYEQDSGAWAFSTKLEGTAGQSFAWVRGGDARGTGIGDAYDHDNNPATANIPIPGGIEANGWNMQGAPGVVTITTVTPEDIAAGNGLLTFHAAYRFAATYGVGATVQIKNVTTGQDLLASSTILDSDFVLDGDGVTLWDFRGEWKFNEFVTTGTASAGDTLQLIFTSNTAQGDAGLQLTDITFQTVSVPEPASLMLLGVGGLCAIRRRA